MFIIEIFIIYIMVNISLRIIRPYMYANCIALFEQNCLLKHFDRSNRSMCGKLPKCFQYYRLSDRLIQNFHQKARDVIQYKKIGTLIFILSRLLNNNKRIINTVSLSRANSFLRHFHSLCHKTLLIVKRSSPLS